MGLIYVKTSSKRKKKKTKAELQAEKEFKAMDAKWAAVPKFGGKYGTDAKHKKLTADLAKKGKTPTGRTVQTFSVVGPKPLPGKLHQGSTAMPKQKIYTGDKVLGVAVMHKSCLAPVFSQQEAEEIAKMRRN